MQQRPNQNEESYKRFKIVGPTIKYMLCHHKTIINIDSRRYAESDIWKRIGTIDSCMSYNNN